MNNFRITINSLPDRENLVAEIYYNHQQWVEISQEAEELIIQFYSHPTKEYWEFQLKDALEALNEAKNRLLKMGGKRT